MADVDGTAGGWGDAPPLAGGRGPKREGERHKLSASAAGQAWEHTLLLLTPIFTCRVGGYASGDVPPLAAGPDEVENSVHNLANVHATTATTGHGRRDQRSDARPLSIGKVGGIRFPNHFFVLPANLPSHTAS